MTGYAIGAQRVAALAEPVPGAYTQRMAEVGALPKRAEAAAQAAQAAAVEAAC